jgi:hypothetical protein
MKAGGRGSEAGDQTKLDCVDAEARADEATRRKIAEQLRIFRQDLRGR